MCYQMRSQINFLRKGFRTFLALVRLVRKVHVTVRHHLRFTTEIFPTMLARISCFWFRFILFIGVTSFDHYYCQELQVQQHPDAVLCVEQDIFRIWILWDRFCISNFLSHEFSRDSSNSSCRRTISCKFYIWMHDPSRSEVLYARPNLSVSWKLAGKSGISWDKFCRFLLCSFRVVTLSLLHLAVQGGIGRSFPKDEKIQPWDLPGRKTVLLVHSR